MGTIGLSSWMKESTTSFTSLPNKTTKNIFLANFILFCTVFFCHSERCVLLCGFFCNYVLRFVFVFLSTLFFGNWSAQK